jgi:hypothetical protein
MQSQIFFLPSPVRLDLPLLSSYYECIYRERSGAMDDQNNTPGKPKWLHGVFLCSSLLFFLIAALVYTRVIDIFDKDIAWVFAAVGVTDFIAAFIFRSRYNDSN